MGWQGNIFQVLIVVSGPNFTGFFVYNGAPAKGNLVAAIVAPGTTSDPFGNTVGAVANFGTWSAAGVLQGHFGIDQFGNTYLANSSGLTVQQGASGDGSQRYYTTAGQAAGNLAITAAPAAGTDAAGNAYLAGETIYTQSAPFIAAQIISGKIQFYTAASQAGPWTANGPSLAFSGAGTGMLLSSGTAGGGTAATFQLINGSVSGNVGNLVGALALSEQALPAASSNTPLLFANTTGHLQAVSDTIDGDGNTYDVERLTLVLGSAVTIDTTGENVFSKHLGLGKYVVEVWMVTSNTIAADVATWGFTFTGTNAVPTLVKFESKTSGTLGYGASGTLTATFVGQNFAGNQDVYMRLTVNVSAAGTLAIHGSTAASTVAVFAGATMEIWPVVAS